MEPGAKVLVVDDYEPNAKGMRDLLVAAGHTVRVASNGADALRFASDEPPDLVVLDVVMPGMSGVDVCRELKTRSLTRLTPVVLVTGSQDHGFRLAGLDAGADDFINKPLDIQEFRTRVKSLLRLKRLTDELESTEAIMTMLGQSSRHATRIRKDIASALPITRPLSAWRWDCPPSISTR